MAERFKMAAKYKFSTIQSVLMQIDAKIETLDFGRKIHQKYIS
jgi:hypothetical protein